MLSEGSRQPQKVEEGTRVGTSAPYVDNMAIIGILAKMGIQLTLRL
jgi:hypothetical protein